GKATPVKAPQSTKRQVPEKPAAIAEYEPVPAAEPAVEAPAEPAATVRPGVSAKSAARPFTVNVATDTLLAPPDTNEPAVTVKIPADLP
ncbi:MAG: hypothetical protein P1P81_05985, partial [Desulfobulbales bacterium]|nr:hypothetical protein [Desulfobulbales bacterium]